MLANVLLNELDQLLDSRGIKFVRYADDMVIMCGSQKAAERILQNVTEFIEKKLFLKVNKDKTKIVRASEESQFLGFAFTQRVSQKLKDAYPGTRYFPTVHKKKRVKFANSVKEILDRRAKGGIATVKRELEMKIRGWSNYFYGAVPDSWMKETDAWIRRRVRQLLWKQWKKPGKRLEEFRKRAKRVPLKSEYAYSSNRYWTMSMTPVIHRILSNKRLLSEGWATLEQFAWKG